MPLRIGFDLDGVLADMDSELLRHAVSLFGDAVKRRGRKPAGSTPDAAVPSDHESPSDAPVPPALSFDLTARQASRLWRQVEKIDSFWESLKEIEPGAISRLAKLAAQRRWEVIFLTKRPDSAGATAQVQSQRWLEARGFTLPSVYVVQGSRGRIAAALALDVVVDDRPENCLDVIADSHARALLLWRGDKVPAAVQRLGMVAVRSVGECLDLLEQIDAPPTKRGVLSRVMRLLGLKAETAAV